MSRHRNAEGRPPGSRPSSRPKFAPASAADQPPAQGSSSALRLAPAGPAEPYRITDLPPAVARRITVHPVSGCWIVGGTPTRDGHARISGRSAARVIWELLVGPVAGNLVVDHREDWGCLSKACGWPAHLLPVTPFVNSTRPGARGVAAVNVRKDHCGRCGRPLDLLNCYWYRSRRDCRACIRRRVAEYRQRQRVKAAGLIRMDRAAELGHAASEGRRAA